MAEETAKSTALALADLGPGNSATLQPSIAPRPRADRIRGLLDAFLRGRKASTLRAYGADLDIFAGFLNEPSREAVVTKFLAQDPGEANAIALAYRNHMVDEGLGSATVNRRLASLRSFIKLARMLGLITWSIEVENVPHESYTDIFGPGAENIGRMVDKSLELGGAQGIRNAAIIRLLYDRGLRRGEVVGCDLEHYDSERGLSLIGKGKRQRVWYTLPEATHEAIQAWIKVRGSASGPLFIALNDVHCGHRLTGNRIYAIVRELGESIGVHARPHRIRHAAISAALVETDGNVQLVQRFSRHVDVNTVLRYDDARKDDALQAANLVAATVPSSCISKETIDEIVAARVEREAKQILVAACCRGHVHEAGARAIGHFCTEEECALEAGKPLPIRRIAWRTPTRAS